MQIRKINPRCALCVLKSSQSVTHWRHCSSCGPCITCLREQFISNTLFDDVLYSQWLFYRNDCNKYYFIWTGFSELFLQINYRYRGHFLCVLKPSQSVTVCSCGHFIRPTCLCEQVISNTFVSILPILRCTLVSVTFCHYDFNKFDFIWTDFSELFLQIHKSAVTRRWSVVVCHLPGSFPTH